MKLDLSNEIVCCIEDNIIEDKDFIARFCPESKRWEITWKFKRTVDQAMSRGVDNYKIDDDALD